MILARRSETPPRPVPCSAWLEDEALLHRPWETKDRAIGKGRARDAALAWNVACLRRGRVVGGRLPCDPAIDAARIRLGAGRG